MLEKEKIAAQQSAMALLLDLGEQHSTRNECKRDRRNKLRGREARVSTASVGAPRANLEWQCKEKKRGKLQEDELHGEKIKMI